MLAETEPSEIPVEASEEELSQEAGWICTRCAATHRGRPRKCRICLFARAPAAAPAASPARLSAEEVAKKRAELQACIACMLSCGAKPNAIADMQATLALLDKPMTPPPQPDLLEQLAEATAAEAAAVEYENALLSKGCELQVKLEEAQADVAALTVAYRKAQQQSTEAAIKMAAVRCAVGAQGTTTGPAATPVAPAAPAQATFMATVDATLARELEALNSQGAEERIRLEMKTFAARVGCTMDDFPMTRYLTERAVEMRLAVTGVTSVKPEDRPLPAEPFPPMAVMAASVARRPWRGPQWRLPRAERAANPCCRSATRSRRAPACQRRRGSPQRKRRGRRAASISERRSGRHGWRADETRKNETRRRPWPTFRRSASTPERCLCRQVGVFVRGRRRALHLHDAQPQAACPNEAHAARLDARATTRRTYRTP